MFKSINKGISTPIAILIIVILAALVGGITVWQYKGVKETKTPEITTPEETPQPEQKNIVLFTDRTGYNRGEEVKISLDYDGDIYVWDYPWSSWSLQRKVEDSWVDLKLGLSPCIVECKDLSQDEIVNCRFCHLEPPRWYLKKGDTVSFTWDQRYIADKETYQCSHKDEIINQECMVYNQVLPGRYKIRLEYALGIQNKVVRKGVDIEYAEKEIIIK